MSDATPESATVHAARMPLTAVTPDALSAMAETATAAADRLANAPIDVAAYACTTGSLLEGPEFTQRITDRLADHLDCPVVVTARAVDRAFSTLGAERIAITTPYVDSLVAKERSYFEALGYDVQAIAGRGIADNAAIGALPPSVAADDATAVVDRCTGRPDAVFISCTNYRTFPVVEQLEHDLGLPVVSSNTATLWAALRRSDCELSSVPGALGDQ